MDRLAAVEAVSAASDVGGDEGAWMPLILAAMRALGGDTVGFMLIRPGRPPAARACPRTDPEWHRRYDADMHRINHLWHAAVGLPAGGALSESCLGDRESYRRSPFFNEFVRPQGMESTLTLALSGAASPMVAHMMIGRRRHREPFQPHEIAAGRGLAGALARTIAVSVLPEDPGGARMFPSAELLVAPDGRMLSRPAGLEGLLRAGIAIDAGGRLEVPALPQLAGAIVAASHDTHSWPPPVSTEIGPVDSGSGPFVLAVRPGGPSAPGAVRLRFSAAPEADPAAAFRRRHGLTEREMQVACLLARGCTLPEIADLLRIGLTTARTHLGRLFDKTDTRTQLALALYVARSVEWPRAGSPGQSGG